MEATPGDAGAWEDLKGQLVRLLEDEGVRKELEGLLPEEVRREVKVRQVMTQNGAGAKGVQVAGEGNSVTIS